MIGYIGDAAKSQETFLRNFYLTGDRGCVDPDGYIWFDARSDDVIISAGWVCFYEHSMKFFAFLLHFKLVTFCFFCHLMTYCLSSWISSKLIVVFYQSALNIAFASFTNGNIFKCVRQSSHSWKISNFLWRIFPKVTRTSCFYLSWIEFLNLRELSKSHHKVQTRFKIFPSVLLLFTFLTCLENSRETWV